MLKKKASSGLNVMKEEIWSQGSRARDTLSHDRFWPPMENCDFPTYRRRGEGGRRNVCFMVMRQAVYGGMAGGGRMRGKHRVTNLPFA